MNDNEKPEPQYMTNPQGTFRVAVGYSDLELDQPCALSGPTAVYVTASGLATATSPEGASVPDGFGRVWATYINDDDFTPLVRHLQAAAGATQVLIVPATDDGWLVIYDTPAFREDFARLEHAVPSPHDIALALEEAAHDWRSFFTGQVYQVWSECLTADGYWKVHLVIDSEARSAVEAWGNAVEALAAPPTG